MDDDPYGFAFNRRTDELILDKNTSKFDGRNDALRNEIIIQGTSENSSYAYNSLFRHNSIRPFTLTLDDVNVTATQSGDDRNYERARNDFAIELDR
jgi:hypothetical protein